MLEHFKFEWTDNFAVKAQSSIKRISTKMRIEVMKRNRLEKLENP